RSTWRPHTGITGAGGRSSAEKVDSDRRDGINGNDQGLKANNGKENTDDDQIAVACGQGHACSAGGHGARPARPEHHGFLQAVQRHNGKRTGRNDFPVLVTVYSDRTFTFILKTPPASVLLKRAANIAKGSAEPNRNKVGKVTKKQVEEIAKIKLVDLNTTSLESAMRTVMGTARNMGLEVVE